MTPEQLRRWRVSRYLTQTELGDLLGYTYKSVNRWEAGATAIPPMMELALRYLDSSQRWVPIRTIRGQQPSDAQPTPAEPTP